LDDELVARLHFERFTQGFVKELYDGIRVLERSTRRVEKKLLEVRTLPIVVGSALLPWSEFAVQTILNKVILVARGLFVVDRGSCYIEVSPLDGKGVGIGGDSA